MRVDPPKCWIVSRLLCFALLAILGTAKRRTDPTAAPKTTSVPLPGPLGVNPVHAWDVYYNWQVPSGTTPKSSWVSDITMEPAAGHKLVKEPGAYVGLQTNGNHRSLVFSVWNGVSGIPDKSPAGVQLNAATLTTSSYCKPFSDDSAGFHCMYTYDWKPRTPYRLRMELVSRNAWGDSIRGSMLDVNSRTEVTIGEIFVPAFYGAPSCSVLFYEYFGSVPDCLSIPAAAITYSNLSLTLRSGSRSIPASWASVASMLNGAGGGACVGWAELDICNTTVTGSSPAAYFLTQAPANRCGVGGGGGGGGAGGAWQALGEVPVWEQQPGDAGSAVLSRLPRLATWL